jgi:hypothetical protein
MTQKLASMFLVQLKTDMSALNEMDGESHFVGRDENLFCRSSCA